MKLTIVCITLIVIAVVECAKHECTEAMDCTCNHDEVATCVMGGCYCTHNGNGKRQTHQHECQADADCGDFDCTHHGGGTPYCQHHGPSGHGHNICGCQ